MTTDAGHTEERSGITTRQPAVRLPVLLVVVLVAFTGQSMLFPVIAPLSRRLEITEVQLGAIITVSALLVAVMSPVWGRAVDRWGPSRVLFVGIGLAGIGLAGFALVSQVALGDERGVTTAEYVLLLLSRGLLFGAGLSAVPVAALAAASVASDSSGRTRAVSLVGAAQALSLVVGAAVGGGLALGGLLVPLWLAPGLLLGIAGLVVVALPARTTGARDTADGVATPVRARLQPWDSRVWPLLATGFALFLAIGIVQIIIGFLVQDRVGLSDEATAGSVGLALAIMGVTLVVIQGVLVPRLGWPPALLLRVGTPIGVVGLLLLAVADTFPAIVAGLVVLAGGLGLAIPGYTAAPTLLAAPEEQGRVAGWVSATNATTFIVGPALGSALYTVATYLPSVVSAGIVAVIWGFLLLHPGLRRAWRETSQRAGQPAPEPGEPARSPTAPPT